MKIKTYAIAIIILIGCAFGFVTFVYYLENPTSSFKNYREAKASGMMEAGWIPSFIPRSSVEIKEKHNIDTNGLHMTFSYTPGDTKHVEMNCNIELSTKGLTRYKCAYYGSEVIIELLNNGVGKLEMYSR